MAGDDFDVVVDGFASRVQLHGPEYVFGVAAEMHTRIKERTPVGERRGGTARSSWHLTPEGLGVYAISTDVIYMPVLEFGEYPGTGPRTVATAEGIFSSQAPAGMVRITALELGAISDQVAATIVRLIEG